jgi:hypothetical protein
MQRVQNAGLLPVRLIYNKQYTSRITLRRAGAVQDQPLSQGFAG